MDGRNSAIRVLDSPGSSKRQAADLAHRHRRKCAQQGYVVVVMFLGHAWDNSQTTLRTRGNRDGRGIPTECRYLFFDSLRRRTNWRCCPLPVSLTLASVGVGEKVRREKALDFSGCKSRPGTGSLHPVAIETAAEATKLPELSMERVARRLRERAGHNASER
jgi:hypothetical protein